MASQMMRTASSTTSVSTSHKQMAQRPCLRAAPTSSSRPARHAQHSLLAPQRLSQRRSSSVRTAAAASAVKPGAEQDQQQKQWFALVANAEFFVNDVQNESFAEQLRERVRYYKEQNRETDFFMVPNPTWLDARFPAEAKQVRRPCVALVSTDATWVTFMKLRLDRVMKLELKGMSTEEVLSMGADLPDFKPPAKWTAPYSPYTPGWWKVFYPSKSA